MTSECIDFIKENKHKPFLAVLSHYLVHKPIQPKKEKLEEYKKKATTDQSNPGYAAMVESVDESVGRLMTTLKELNISENTLVVFTSDNGGYSPEPTSNYPLLGGKSYSFEGGVAVPLIMHWPAVIRSGRISKEKTIAMDLYPTFLDAAHAEPRPSQHADGVSLMPVLKDSKALAKRSIIFHYPHYTGATSPYSSIIDGNLKVIHFYNYGDDGYLLFDLDKDREEQTDLAGSRPEDVQRLSKMLEQSLTELGAEMPIPNPDYNTNRKIDSGIRSYERAKKQRAKLESQLK